MGSIPNIVKFSCLFGYIFSIISIVLFSFQFAYNLEVDELYPSLVDSWQKNPIIEIEKLFFMEDCDQNKGWVPLFNYTWPGTEEGCHCDDGSTELGACCCGDDCNVCCGDEIPSNDPVNLNTWELLDAPLNVCGKQIEGTTFIDIMPENADNTCPENKKTCGKGEKIVCIDNDQKCPINSLRWKQLKSSDDPDLYETLELYPEIYIYYSRMEEAYPITNFKVAEGDGVCFNQENYGIVPNRNYSPLLINVQECKEQDIDDGYQKLTSITEQIFFLINGFNREGYKFKDKSEYSAFYKNYSDMKCPEKLQDIIDFENLHRNDLYINSLMIVIFGSIYGFHLIFINFYIILAFSEKMAKFSGTGVNIYDNGIEEQKCAKIYSIFPTIIFLIYIGFSVEQFRVMIILENILDYITNNECVTGNNIYFVNKMREDYNNLGITLTLNIFWIIQFFLEPNIYQMLQMFYRWYRIAIGKPIQNIKQIQPEQNTHKDENNQRSPIQFIERQLSPNPLISYTICDIDLYQRIFTKQANSILSYKLPQNIEEIMNSSCPFNQGQYVRDTHILFYMPQTIDNKVLNLDTLNELQINTLYFSGKKQLQSLSFQEQGLIIPQHLQNEKERWIIITKNCIPSSFQESYLQTQSKLPANYFVPNAFEIIFTQYVGYIIGSDNMVQNNFYIRTSSYTQLEHTVFLQKIDKFNIQFANDQLQEQFADLYDNNNPIPNCGIILAKEIN